MALVLSADDDPDIQLVIRIGLERAGHTVVSVSDGAAALQAVKRHRPDLVILDNHMPKMTGLQVCAAIRADPELRHTPVVLASGSIPPDLGADEFGADGVLSKPFTPSELRKITAEYV